MLKPLRPCLPFLPIILSVEFDPLQISSTLKVIRIAANPKGKNGNATRVATNCVCFSAGSALFVSDLSSVVLRAYNLGRDVSMLAINLRKEMVIRNSGDLRTAAVRGAD